MLRLRMRRSVYSARRFRSPPRCRTQRTNDLEMTPEDLGASQNDEATSSPGQNRGPAGRGRCGAGSGATGARFLGVAARGPDSTPENPTGDGLGSPPTGRSSLQRGPSIGGIVREARLEHRLRGGSGRQRPSGHPSAKLGLCFRAYRCFDPTAFRKASIDSAPCSRMAMQRLLVSVALLMDRSDLFGCAVKKASAASLGSRSQ